MQNRSAVNSIVLADRAVVNIAAIAEYRRLFAKIGLQRARYYKVHKQTLAIVNSYFEKDERHQTVVRLRREIRLATRGTPITISQESITAAGYVSVGTEQLYNAQSHLVRSAYLAVRKMVHPDLTKGNRELFQLVNTAYRLKDLTFLQETYLMLVKAHDVFWQAHEGLAWAAQEVERPGVSLKILQSTPEFAIASAHLRGRVQEAQLLAKSRLTRLVVELQAELNHLLT
jgi:hypothetical protein